MQRTFFRSYAFSPPNASLESPFRGWRDCRTSSTLQPSWAALWRRPSQPSTSAACRVAECLPTCSSPRPARFEQRVHGERRADVASGYGVSVDHRAQPVDPSGDLGTLCAVDREDGCPPKSPLPSDWTRGFPVEGRAEDGQKSAVSACPRSRRAAPASQGVPLPIMATAPGFSEPALSFQVPASSARQRITSSLAQTAR